MRKIKAFILSYLILILLWLALTGWKGDELIIGSLSAVILAWVFSARLIIMAEFRLSPKSLWFSFVYIFVFLRELVMSAVDVARRVISPALPINPGIVKVRTRLKSKLGRIVLANSITLTPGTMTVESKGEYLYIHWIDIKGEDIETATKNIVNTFERYLEVIYG